MKGILLILLLLFLNNHGITQNQLLPYNSLEDLEKEQLLCNKLDLGDYQKSRILIDSIISADFNHYETFLNIAFKTKYDSLYNTNLYDLINELVAENSEEQKAAIALEIKNYGFDAIIALEKIENLTQSTHYWKDLIYTLILGYQINTTYAHKEIGGFYSQQYNLLPPKSFQLSTSSTINTNYSHLIKSIMPSIEELSSNATNKKKLHDLCLSAIMKGKLNSNFKYSFIQSVLINEVKTKDEDLLNDYTKVIDIIDEQDAIFILEVIGSNRFDFFPNILVDALNSKNENVIIHALSLGFGSWDEELPYSLRPKLSSLLKSSSNDTLKYAASISLYTNYQDSMALDYLLKEIEINRFNNRINTIRYLEDIPSKIKMDEKIDIVLENYLTSEDERVFETTISTYLAYIGKNVIKSLIPFIDHEKENISNSIISNFTNCRDSKIVVEELVEFLKIHPNRTKQQDLLNILKK